MDVIYRTCFVQNSYFSAPQLQESIVWEVLAKIIIQCKHQLRYPNAGLALCGFSINYLNGNKVNMLSYTILENGKDSIKSLNEYLLDGNINLKSDLRELIKNLINVGLDRYKTNIKKSLKEEKLLFVP